MGRKTWTEQDEEYLLEHYGELQLNEIAEYLGKTVDAVDTKLRRMNVPRIGLKERMHQLAVQGKHPMHRPEVVKNFIGDKNPSCQPEVRAKISAFRKKEYQNGTSRCGWKGPQQAPTEAEKLIMNNLLNLDFKWNLNIRTGHSSHKKEANHYTLDFANETFKVCIELDGSSHRNNQDRDDRKDDFLTSNGWTVLRFKNEEVISNMPLVLEKIVSTLDRFGDGKQAEAKARTAHK